MTKPRANKGNVTRRCALCMDLTKEFLRAHIPRKSTVYYYVHPRCEQIINYIVSPRDQERMSLEEARRIVKENKEVAIR